MSKNEARLGRVNEELMKALSQIITYELKNPDVTGMIRLKICESICKYVKFKKCRKNYARVKRLCRLYEITSC